LGNINLGWKKQKKKKKNFFNKWLFWTVGDLKEYIDLGWRKHKKKEKKEKEKLKKSSLKSYLFIYNLLFIVIFFFQNNLEKQTIFFNFRLLTYYE
jgi:hypothetical protein